MSSPLPLVSRLLRPPYRLLERSQGQAISLTGTCPVALSQDPPVLLVATRRFSPHTRDDFQMRIPPYVMKIPSENKHPSSPCGDLLMTVLHLKRKAKTTKAQQQDKARDHSTWKVNERNVNHWGALGPRGMFVALNMIHERCELIA